MKFKFLPLLPFVALGASVAPLQAQLLVTEINSDGAGGDFWELTNVGASFVDISGYKWNDSQRSFTGSSVVTIPANTLINAGESIVFNVTGTADAFRTAWNVAATVKVVSGGPGLGMNDGIALYNATGTELFYLTYASGGFTRTDGSASAGGHAGVSAGAASTVSMIWNPSFAPPATPRYSAASVGSLGCFAHSTSATTIGSPGFSGFAVAPPSVILSVSAAPSTFSESATNPASIGTVTRAVATASDLVVNLSSSDVTEASFPASVTILANQTSANFNITAVDDSFPDGSKSVSITASAADATAGLATLTVTDDGDVITSNLMLTEILSNQSSPNSLGTADEDYWELTNFGTTSVDLTGFTWHDSGRSVSAAAGYKFPVGSAIAAGESVIFTAADPTFFRSWWGLAPSVKIFQSIGAPGLGSGDGVSFFDNTGNEMFFFSYAAGGFTREDGSSSTTGHAGPAAGAGADTIAMIWVPTSGTTVTTGTPGATPPRYTFATGSNYGSRIAATNADLGSPGITDGVPSVSISSASVTEGNSGTKTLSLNVTRNANSTAFSVDYAVTGGTATSGDDYTLIPGTLSFTAGGPDTLPINITISGDTASENDETVIVTLSNIINTTGTAVIANATATATILTDDTIPAMIATPPGATTIVTGGATTLSISVTGSPTPNIQWYQGVTGNTSTPVGTSSPTFTTPALTATTSYWARVSNIGGSVDTDTITVTIVAGVVGVDLSTYVRTGRFGLPEYRRTPLPPGTASHNLLCDEASAVTYNWDTDTLFISCDGGRSITQVSKTGQLIDTMSLALQAGAPQGTAFYDPEGITYLGNGEFVISEERDRQLVKFTYAAGTTLTRANAQTVDLGTFDDNTGTEGLSWDPQTNGFIVLKEKNPIGVFQTNIDFAAGTATNGSPTTVNSTNLFDTTLLGLTDVADVFAFSNIPTMVGQPQAGNLLIVGQEDARILNITRAGVIQSSLNITAAAGDLISSPNMQHEGITMDRAGNIYVVNENGGGSIQFPELWVYSVSSAPNTAPSAVTLNNAVTSLQENSSTASPVKVADIAVTDDGLGSNTLALTGADAAFFEITAAALFIKAGVALDFETKPSYAVTISVDDTTVGATPDATVNYNLTITDQVVEIAAAPAVLITEVAPWSSGNSPGVAADWFEITNVSSNPVTVTGWKVDDNSNSFASAITLNGITSIAPGESVIFVESTPATQAAIVNNFKTNWFGASPPVGLQVGTYTGAGIGLGTSGDALNLFNAVGALQANVTFGVADAVSPFQTFDNTAALNSVPISLLSEIGVNGAFAAANAPTEIGSPGFSAPAVLRVTETAPWSSGNSPVAADWFEVTNLGARAANITGWLVDDNSESAAAAGPITGITSIAPGESVIFIDSANLETIRTTFLNNWFGANPPANLQIGAYSGAGGLGTSGDAVNLYDTASPTRVRQVNFAFGASPGGAPFTTFDNAAGLNVATGITFSAIGTNGAFVAVNSGSEIGSPGRILAPSVGASTVSLAAAAISEGNAGTVTLNLPVTRTNAASGFTVNYAVTGGTATSGTDFAPLAAGTLTFTPGGSVTQNISITVNGDITIESNETVIVTLSNVLNSTGITTIGTAAGTGTITNDDTVPVVFPASNSLTSTLKGSVALAGAEIPAFDPLSDRAFASSGAGIQVVNLADPTNPVFISTITPSTLGVPGITSDDISSVAVRKGSGANPSVLAAAIISNPKTNPGFVVFLNAATGALIGHATVGVVPDHIAFTPDGTRLLVANEGELSGSNATIPDSALGTVSIIPVGATGIPGSVATADFTAFDAPATVTSLRNEGVRFFGAGAVPSTDFEPEYFAVSPDGTKAMVTLQEANAVAVLDIATATFTSVKALGKKDFSNLRVDLSDQDGVKNPKTGQPVFGLYMPDAIAAFSSGGQTFYITANEGDDRNDFLSPDESILAGNAAYVLDPVIFPDAAALKLNTNLGRLTVSNFPGLRGDTNNDGDIDEILMYGARSFSILDSTGAIVFDSGDMVEMIVASLHNSQFDDNRSDNKGPEPEGVTVAVIGNRTFAFLGLERAHMTLVFDITNPLAPTYVTSLVRTGDFNPEGLVVVSEADSPSGRPLLIVSNESSNTLTVFELTPATDYTLQLLHLADAEAGLLASQTAPNLAALVDAFDGTFPNTLILAGGDNFIPGPFISAGTDPLVSATHNKGNNPAAADIEIHNRIGVEASTVGNHEFDLGTNAFSDAIADTNFPYLSANLDFSGDSGISARYQETVGVGGLEEASSVKNKIVPSAVVTKNGQKIGLVGATTQIIEAISSTGGVEVKGFVGDGSEVDNMVLLASQIQPVINDLKSQGVNKIILMAHLQQIANEQTLAPLLTDVDIILAAGSNTRLGDATDVAVAFAGHAANFAGNYPIYTAGADGKPTVIVNTDNEFTYLGRLVADFDADGNLIVPNLTARTAINGAYAATAANVATAWGVTEANLATTAFAPGTKGAGVKQITDAVQGVISTKDGDVRGFTSVYLEGERNFVRNQETNLGNISADSMITVGETALPANRFVAALKNGGGIRAQIGAVAVGSGAKLPPLANPAAGKLSGGISLLDIENSMRFNNGLMLCDVTPTGLKAILEHGVFNAGTSNGRFPQIGGIRFSYNPALTAGSRVRSIVTLDQDDNITGRILANGVVVPGAPTITLVTLNFLAQGGDSYPFKANADNFRYLLNNGTLSAPIDESLDFGAAGVVPANLLREQAALSSHLTAFHATPATAYNRADTLPALDTRIQSIAARTDTVALGPVNLTVWLADNGFANGSGDGDNDTLNDLQEFAFGLNPNAGDNTQNNTNVANGILVSRGTPAIYSVPTANGQDFRVVFVRRKNPASVGLVYTPQFSSDMISGWESRADLPVTIIASDGDVEAVSIPYPFFVNGKKARFFRVGVSSNN